eukprot:CAMPEP_0182841192 /NCGR_PEP_ID=MMETSP0006_2-20121128/24889_1 /TAXON_ID=97485 /ORGANISM="Prymnesium parvum, Strain Texoma1" /LENGTH=201 /DNA_ID=CAMNT_0024970633 /DNA_START=233 /DNA_END=835 /DNA_ORIENTATION=-
MCTHACEVRVWRPSLGVCRGRREQAQRAHALNSSHAAARGGSYRRDARAHPPQRAGSLQLRQPADELQPEAAQLGLVVAQHGEERLRLPPRLRGGGALQQPARVEGLRGVVGGGAAQEEEDQLADGGDDLLVLRCERRRQRAHRRRELRAAGADGEEQLVHRLAGERVGGGDDFVQQEAAEGVSLRGEEEAERLPGVARLP